MGRLRAMQRLGWRTAALAVAAAALGLAGIALAKSSPPKTVKSAHNAQLSETIVVDGRGRTVYELRPETAHHLLCTSGACLQFWPPVTAGKHAKLTKAAGISGKLGLLHRHGFYQVTLGGRPLYRFSADSAAGDANGNGIKSFGGTWHVVKAKPHSGGTSTTSTTSSTTSTSMTSSSSTTTYPGY